MYKTDSRLSELCRQQLPGGAERSPVYCTAAGLHIIQLIGLWVAVSCSWEGHWGRWVMKFEQKGESTVLF